MGDPALLLAARRATSAYLVLKRVFRYLRLFVDSSCTFYSYAALKGGTRGAKAVLAWPLALRKATGGTGEVVLCGEGGVRDGETREGAGHATTKVDRGTGKVQANVGDGRIGVKLNGGLAESVGIAEEVIGLWGADSGGLRVAVGQAEGENTMVGAGREHVLDGGGGAMVDGQTTLPSWSAFSTSLFPPQHQPFFLPSRREATTAAATSSAWPPPSSPAPSPSSAWPATPAPPEHVPPFPFVCRLPAVPVQIRTNQDDPPVLGDDGDDHELTLSPEEWAALWEKPLLEPAEVEALAAGVPRRYHRVTLMSDRSAAAAVDFREASWPDGPPGGALAAVFVGGDSDLGRRLPAEAEWWRRMQEYNEEYFYIERVDIGRMLEIVTEALLQRTLSFRDALVSARRQGPRQGHERRAADQAVLAFDQAPAAQKDDRPPPLSASLRDHIPLLELARLWPDSAMLERQLTAWKTDGALLNALWIASGILGDHSPLESTPPKGALHLGAVRLASVVALCSFSLSSVLDVLEGVGYGVKDGIVGIARGVLASITIIGVLNSYRTASSTYTALATHLPGIYELLHALEHELEAASRLSADYPRKAGLGSASSSFAHHLSTLFTPLSFLPARIYRLYILSGALPVEGTSSLTPALRVGSSEPGTLAPMSGNPGLWDADVVKVRGAREPAKEVLVWARQVSPAETRRDRLLVEAAAVEDDERLRAAEQAAQESAAREEHEEKEWIEAEQEDPPGPDWAASVAPAETAHNPSAAAIVKDALESDEQFEKRKKRMGVYARVTGGQGSRSQNTLAGKAEKSRLAYEKIMPVLTSLAKFMAATPAFQSRNVSVDPPRLQPATARSYAVYFAGYQFDTQDFARASVHAQPFYRIIDTYDAASTLQLLEQQLSALGPPAEDDRLLPAEGLSPLTLDGLALPPFLNSFVKHFCHAHSVPILSLAAERLRSARRSGVFNSTPLARSPQLLRKFLSPRKHGNLDVAIDTVLHAVAEHAPKVPPLVEYEGDLTAQEMRALSAGIKQVLSGSWSPETGPNGPLRTCKSDTSIEKSVKLWTSRGFPASQILLFGIPSYAISFTTTSSTLEQTSVLGGKWTSELYQQWTKVTPKGAAGDSNAGGTDVCGNTSSGSYSGQWQYKDLISEGLLSSDGSTGQSGFTRRFDSCSATPFLFNPDKKQLIAYDDAKSASIKASWAKANGLAGVMLFDSTGFDDSVYQAIQTSLNSRKSRRHLALEMRA
ncbi:hypothetical protein JCM10213_002833 [Rhodosporidiobolus nylandii]